MVRYLVRSYGDEYQLFARVDVSNVHSWWRRAVLAAFVVGFSAIAYAVATHQPSVRFVNGFDRQLTEL